jgi:DNA-3-methyladenine glycosylase
VAGLEDPSAQLISLLERPALVVAPRLLGAALTHESADGTVTVRITEVEAYDGANDPGSHAYRGRTPRNDVMFGPPGVLYVYFSYGMHWCANVVCGPAGRASAVLLRAGEVVDGVELARLRRPAARVDRDLARGPARLTEALGLDGSHDGAPLNGHALHLRPRQRSLPRRTISSGPRVGVSGAGGDAESFPWRFWLTGDPTVSAYRPGGSGSRSGSRVSAEAQPQRLDRRS